VWADVEHGLLDTSLGQRQAKRMPMLFSPTIGAAIKVVPQFEKEWVISTG
jgi:hypothetical protein